ncbi:hypothetical protein F0U44_21995 [Nocardioides humilatus]|uniref:Uncharacterized protein n=1 Tax=Nocardioides humilatus TaxID=2607660 RepID=A0A5B1L4C9_9ACTN|nr:hypothetical protein [Nocardioides humilatus]KAA1415354.1 hypothetical protein F0U44_21995 [Nocardioides humilatus]
MIAVALLPVAGISAVLGLILTGLGVAGGETVEECSGHLMWKECEDVYHDWSRGTDIFLMGSGTFLLVVALLSVVTAIRLATRQGHLKRYMAILTGVETMSIERIADITRSRPSRVRSEIQSMIDSGMVNDFYIDYGADQVVSKKYVPKMSHKTVVKCSECGGNNDLIVGITKHCSFCGQPLLLGTT